MMGIVCGIWGLGGEVVCGGFDGRQEPGFCRAFFAVLIAEPAIGRSVLLRDEINNVAWQQPEQRQTDRYTTVNRHPANNPHLSRI